MKDILVAVTFEVRIGETQLKISRTLESDLWRERPLAVLEFEAREMLMQLLAPAVTAFDTKAQSMASGAPPGPGREKQRL